MSAKMNSCSRSGLAILLALSLASSGCATWNKLIGKKDEPSPRLNLEYAKFREAEGDLTTARHRYEEVLAKDANNVTAIMGMARLNLKANRLVEAESGFQRALELEPKSTEVLSAAGNFYADQQRWDKAIPLLQECQRIEPHEKKYQYNLAVALAKSGRTKESLSHFKEAVGDSAAHYDVGRIMIESGRLKEAEEQMVLALQKDPNCADAKFYLDELRATSSGRAQQLPVVADAASGGPQTQQVAASRPARQQAEANLFEEAPASDFSRSAPPTGRRGQPARTRMNNQQDPNRPTASGRFPDAPHQGFEELPPPEDANYSADAGSARVEVSASSVIQASAEEPGLELDDSTMDQSSETAPRVTRAMFEEE